MAAEHEHPELLGRRRRWDGDDVGRMRGAILAKRRLRRR
jgi:hypothetical protein